MANLTMHEREAAFGIKWKDFDPADKYDENWSKFREALGKVDGWYKKSDGKWLVGDNVTFVDLAIGGWIRYLSLALEKEEWEDLRTWNDGRWGRMVEELEKHLL
ncbi:hypothetical protein BJ138DRAFT_261299 [Hygrophoropsis aurantiaca]|uniref:Uncharacterized protein n=1 Tax=Hygrophoropsis aurantiaca TaxID=72124 RepID=A0ACB7ZQ92_9AGAM|nr:hypothetical protein BJ138DRAFT_261299 [Hygrophoropsis aurantiaca]